MPKRQSAVAGGFTFLVLLLHFAAAHALAADVHVCYRVHTPPTVDGRLDEAAWRAATPIPLADIVTGQAPPFAFAARAKVLWNNERLYVAYEVHDTNVWARITERDAPLLPNFRRYTENLAKLYIDPDGDGRNYVEMHLSPSGALSDKWQALPWNKTARKKLGHPLHAPAAPHWEWNCDGIAYAVAVQGTLNQPGDEDQGWTAEIAIPFASLKFLAPDRSWPPADGDSWKVHLGRRCQSDPEAKEASYWTWPTVGEKDCHRVDTWGCLVFTADEISQAPPPADLPKGRFQWKMLWSRPLKSPAEVEQMAHLAEKMGFNVVAAHPDQAVIRAVHAKGMQFYAWVINLADPRFREFCTAHPEYCQKVAPAEESLVRKPRINPDRENIHSGPWLCPDRGLTDVEKQWLTAVIRMPGVDGLALDYIGYRNYHACSCDYSNEKRKQFARAHPELSPEQVEWKFSEHSLAEYTRQIRELAVSINPRLKLAIHIYPDFDPNPCYGNALPVDYCGQTICWFYKPFWSHERMYELAQRCTTAAGKHRSRNVCVPFVSVERGRRARAPEDVRTAIRIAGAANTGAIMVAFYRTFLEQPSLVDVFAQELK